eukprot:scaffold3148_cov343-Prasinococcus_capsulatus_cf.AAC.5
MHGCVLTPPSQSLPGPGRTSGPCRPPQGQRWAGCRGSAARGSLPNPRTCGQHCPWASGHLPSVAHKDPARTHLA